MKKFFSKITGYIVLSINGLGFIISTIKFKKLTKKLNNVKNKETQDRWERYLSRNGEIK